MTTPDTLNHDLADPQRRRLLGGASLAGALGLASLSSLVAPASAQADDYKALVCFFQYGGNDGMNMLVPRDATRHAQYAAVRGALAIPRDQLVALDASYGLHPAMAALGPVWAEGALTAVHNVGPLFAPLTKTQYRAASAADPIIPEALFSHSDQQLHWETAQTVSTARTGWGGRAAFTFATTNPVISFGGNANFGLAETSSPWVLPGPGSTFGAQGFGSFAPVAARRQALDRLMAERQKSPMAEVYARIQREAYELETRLAGLFTWNANPASDPTGVTSAFAPLIVGGQLSTGIARQLYQVARFIANRGTVRGTRQVFFVQQGGFDTHSEQIGGSATTGTHADLLRAGADAMAAFWRAMKAIGMGNRVTLFTQSDFGRTFTPNESSGTDHAWGNEHLVMGGAVVGGVTHGRYPVLSVGGPDDVGVNSWELQGRWIPSTSVDQYAATLLRWWGMNDGQINLALPNLANFGSARNVGFMQA